MDVVYTVDVVYAALESTELEECPELDEELVAWRFEGVLVEEAAVLGIVGLLLFELEVALMLLVLVGDGVDKMLLLAGLAVELKLELVGELIDPDAVEVPLVDDVVWLASVVELLTEVVVASLVIAVSEVDEVAVGVLVVVRELLVEEAWAATYA